MVAVMCPALGTGRDMLAESISSDQEIGSLDSFGRNFFGSDAMTS